MRKYTFIERQSMKIDNFHAKVKGVLFLLAMGTAAALWPILIMWFILTANDPLAFTRKRDHVITKRL